MKRFIISALVILVGVFVVDRIGGQIMWWVNQHSHDTTAPKIKYLVNGVNEDVVLMGTSRCQGHYVSSIIADSLGMSVYNGGIDASENIFSHYIMFSHLLAGHTPKVICLDVRRNDLFVEADPYKSVSFFAPYFGRNRQADSVYYTAGKATGYVVSHLYRYNSKAASNIIGLIYNKQALKGEDNGYLPILKPTKTIQISEDFSSPKTEEIDTNKLDYLQRFIAHCKERNIELFLIVSPAPSRVDNHYYAALKDLADRNGITFMDYHTSGLFLDHPEFFKDSQHLWDEGARLFSSIFAKDLKLLLKGKN